jgi:hypothetical protein
VAGIPPLILAIATGLAHPARAADAKCSLYPSLEEVIRVAVPPQNDVGKKTARATLLGIMPGAVRDIREAYTFYAERAHGPRVPLQIEGPVSDDELERRFGKTLTHSYETYWILPIPAADDKARISITYHHFESGRDDATGAPCSVEFYRTILMIEAADSTK